MSVFARFKKILTWTIMSTTVIALSTIPNALGNESSDFGFKIQKAQEAKIARQLTCLARNVFYEAGSESIKGQAAVARVVMNRVREGFAKTPCAVIYQTTQTDSGKVCQFSWVCENKADPNPSNYRYKIAKQVAYDVIVNDKYDDVVPDHILYFHNLTVTPLWPYASAVQIGNHIFYSMRKRNGRQTK